MGGIISLTNPSVRKLSNEVMLYTCAMTSTVTCPSCGHQFSPDDLLTHEIEIELRAKLESELLIKAKEQAAKELSDRDAQIKELKLQAKESADFELKLRAEKRSIEEAKEKFELDKTRQLDEERSKIRADAEKTILEKEKYKIDEYEKKLRDMQKSLEDAQRKGSQASQQLQGEVVELDVEHILKAEFPTDQITEVKKGQHGADLTQIVVDRLGRECGTILWEVKNGKWSDGWISKLKADGRSAHAHVFALVATQTPDNISSFAYLDGVWVVNIQSLVALATAMRFNLVSLNNEQVKNQGKQEKAEVLYQYVTSHEFRGRIEAIVEAFTGMQDEIEKEKRWFNTKWSRQEKQIRSVIDNTQGMYSDMQGYIGKALPNLSQLELPE
ncbi:MAG: hypothetical protein UX62_C0016G0006 [Microgenomates group bacterium GW2011_GWA2_46_7]|nr:MAG: hypothetical protein UX62_C0016G0006 [Microgenomates group bacterium GW2011_GWA2_46_7]